MPMDGWYGPAIDNHAPSHAGEHLGPVTVGVLHTTESTRFVPAKNNYFGHSSYPHFTVAVTTINGKRVFRVWQHISIRYAAKALKNLSGGVETNREGSVQVEVVGSATRPFTDDPVMVQGLAALMRWIESETQIKPRSDVRWIEYPASYGTKASQRLTHSQWRSYVGWLGHQHVPENDHGDPGAIDIASLLPRKVAPATTKPTTAPAPTPALETKHMFIYTDPRDGLDWGTDLVTRRPFYSQADKAVWVALVERETKTEVTRRHPTTEEIDVLPIVGAREG